MIGMKETRFKPLLFAAVSAALTLSPATKAAENADYIRFSGAGLDYTTWNGALLVGPGHSLWASGSAIWTATGLLPEVILKRKSPGPVHTALNAYTLILT